MSADADIQCSAHGGLAKVVLNRPKAMNALTHAMCVAFHAKLAAWAGDPSIEALIIHGAGERAFCAGGDIRKLYDEGQRGGDYPRLFYRDEYRLNAAVYHFPKPYIACIDGIVMGGGVGISVHGSHRIVTERTTFAMPETGIGLFPDVGGSYFLPRCPGRIGMFLGLTGTRLKAADAIQAGIGDAYVPADRLGELESALRAATIRSAADVDRLVARFAADPGPAALAQDRARIDQVFGLGSVEQILAELHRLGGDWAGRQAALVAGKSPTSLTVTYRQIRAGAAKDFDACMRMEWRMVNRFIAGHDFYEGTRAVVIDKDQKPNWQPAGLDEVSDDAVEAYFAPLADGDLTLD